MRRLLEALGRLCRGPGTGHARATPEAALIEVARGRLRSLGLPVPEVPPATVDAELRLYELPAARHPDRDPYSLYGAWLEQLDSFVRALTTARARGRHEDERTNTNARRRAPEGDAAASPVERSTSGESAPAARARRPAGEIHGRE